MKNWTLGILIAAMTCVALLAGGCSSEQVEQYRAARVEMQAALTQAQTELTAARATIDELTAQIEATPDGPDKDAAIEARDRVAGLIARGEAVIPELEAGIQRADAAIEAAMAGDAAGAVNAIGPYLASKTPPPWNVYILVGTTVLGGVLSYIQKRKKDEAQELAKHSRRDADYEARQRQRAMEDAMEAAARAEQTRKAAADVIAAIEYEKGDNDTVNFADPNTKVSLRSSMSTEARELVEQVRRQLPPRVATLSVAKDTTAPGSAA